jgi:hypothetical protein
VAVARQPPATGAGAGAGKGPPPAQAQAFGMVDVQAAYEAISAAQDAKDIACPHAVSASGVQVDGDDIGWKSPRMMLALKQAGTEARELQPRPAGRFENQARKEGLTDWKSVAARRELAAEKQRTKLVIDVVELRRQLVESGSKGLVSGPAPEARSKQAEAAVAAETKRAFEDSQRQMERVMSSQSERFEKEKKIMEQAAKLKIEREEAAAIVSMKFEERKAQQLADKQARQKAAMEWELQRTAKKIAEERIAQENGVKALAAMAVRDIEIEKKQAEVRKEAAKIGVRFRAERAKKLESIMAQNRAKEEQLAEIAAKSVVKQEESDRVREEKLAAAHAKVKAENAERTAIAAKRLAAHEASLAQKEEGKKLKAEQKFAVVDVRLEAKRKKKEEEITAARKRAADAAAGRDEQRLAREFLMQEQSVKLQKKAEIADEQVAKVVANKARLLEMKVVESQLTFEEKRSAIKRIQKRQEFEHQMKVDQMEQFLDRTEALTRAKKKALNQRKEQARIVLLKCRALREEDSVRCRTDIQTYTRGN